MGTGDIQLRPEDASDLAKLRDSVGTMSDDDLNKQWRATHPLLKNIQFARKPGFEGLDALAAPLPGDDLSKMEQAEADEVNRYNDHVADERKKILIDELHRRGMVQTSEPGNPFSVWTRADPIPELKFDAPAPAGDDPPVKDTGHYDDAHAFGWGDKPKNDVSDEGDTGHYDDGHAFGWQRPAVAPASPIGSLPKPALAAGAVLVLVVAAGGFALANRGSSASPAPTATVAAPTVAAPTVAAAASAKPAAAADTCSLVTTQEAGGILNGAAVTTKGTTPPGPQCQYTPSQRVVFSFQETSRTAQIRLDNVVITVYTGSQAASQFAAKQGTYGKNSDDEQVSGVGDQAIYTGGQQLSVLRGTSYVNVNAQVDYDWGEGNTRYEDVRTKYVRILSAFAKDALARMP